MAAKQKNLAENVKTYLADPAQRIALHDLAMKEIQAFRTETSTDSFALDVKLTKEEIEDRLDRYDSIISERLDPILVLTCYWGDAQHHVILRNVLAQLVENENPDLGTDTWANMRWYPLLRSVYGAGIAAVASSQYHNLAALLFGWGGVDTYRNDLTVLARVSQIIRRLDPTIKNLSKYERSYTPASNYLFSTLNPVLVETLHLGTRYDSFFDRFEALLALLYADSTGRGWVPVGRFGWKERHHDTDSPTSILTKIRKEIEERPTIFEAGMFGGSEERFETAHAAVHEQLQRLSW